MLISQFPELAPVMFETGLLYSFIGHAGIGKTAQVLKCPEYIHAATGKRIGIVIVNAATCTPTHLMGFGVVKHLETHSEMRFSDPFFFLTYLEGLRLHEFPDGGIVFIDEKDKADPDVMKNLGELGYSKRIGTHRLPPHWVVWMAGNPADARYGSKKQLDYLINREVSINVIPDPDGWQDWGVQAGLLPSTLSFASPENYRSVVFANKLPEVQGPYCTARSLHALDIQLQTRMRLQKLTSPPDDDSMMEFANGTIGAAAAMGYFTNLRKEVGLPKLQEILADPEGCRLPPTDCMALLCFNMAYDVTLKNIGAIIKYVDRLPREFGSTFMRAAVRRDAKLITAPALGQWAQKNSALYLLLNKYSQPRG